jgi:mono/diheme cytochrome c family protein
MVALRTVYGPNYSELFRLQKRAFYDTILMFEPGWNRQLSIGGVCMRFVCALAGALALLVGVLLAQSDADYQGWMKTVAATNGSMNKNIAAKDSAGASADAMKLADTFKEVGGFWQKRGGAPDAVNFAKAAQDAAAAVSKDAAANNWDQAAADAKTVAAQCGQCHMAHREKGDSGFKIK